MKKKFIYRFAAILMLLILVIVHCGFAAAQKVYAEDNAAAFKTDLQAAEDFNNTQNAVKVLALRVGFADMPLSDISSDESITREDIRLYFEGAYDEALPYEGIRGYYRRSSYGQLDLSLTEIVDVELTQTRESFFGESGTEAEYELINEILSNSDLDGKLSDYDSDGDGAADFVYFFCNGSKQSKGSIWWPHCHTESDNIFIDKGYALKNYILSCKEPVNVLLHETGHLLGLPDYYSYEDYYTYDFNVPDMMSDNLADHNGLSKWLAGWIKDDEIAFVNKENTDKDATQVRLSPVDSEDSDMKKIAVISPEPTGQYGEYFLVEYISGTGNMSMYDGRRNYPEGFRIIHVFFDDEKKLLYANALTRDQTTGADFGVFGESDEISPYTVPSTDFIKNGEPSDFTGIIISDFVTGADPHFTVRFSEDEKKNSPVSFVQSTENMSNMLELTLESDRPLIIKNEDAAKYVYLERDGAIYPLILNADEYNATKFYLEYRDIKNPLLPETLYTLVFPENTFTDSYGEAIGEIRQGIRTGSFTKLEDIKSMGDGNLYPLRSKPLPYGNSPAYVVMTGNSGIAGIGFKFVSFDSDESNSAKEFFLEIPEEADKVRALDAFASYDGDYIISVRTDNNTYVKKVSYDGEYKSKLISLPESVDIIELGDTLKGISTEQETDSKADMLSGSFGEFTGSILTFDFTGRVEKKLYNYSAYISDGFFSVNDSRYCIAGYDAQNDIYYINVYDKDDHFIKRIDYSKDLPLSFCSDKDTVTSVEIAFDETGMEHFVIRGHDLLNYESTQKKFYAQNLDEMYLSGVRLKPAGWGYILYYRYSGKTKKSLSKILFLNKDLEIIGSVSLPGSADFLAQSDRAVVVWEDDEGRSMAWTELILGKEKDINTNSPVINRDELLTNRSSTGEISSDSKNNSFYKNDNFAAAENYPQINNDAYTSKAADTGVRDNTYLWCIIAGCFAVGIVGLLFTFKYRKRD